MADGEGRWQLLDSERVCEVLASEDQDVQRQVRDALRRLLENPSMPADLVTYPLRGKPARTYPDRWIAKLPGGWALTYSIHPDGLPPLGRRLLMVHAFVRVV